jgi:hypothetical protein
VKIADDTFDVEFDLLGTTELSPGEHAAVAVSFLAPDLVYARVHAGDALAVLEGGREIGNLVVRADVWKDPSRLVQVGRDYGATVTKVGWTAAEVTLENGWTATLRSRDLGLPPWGEIGTALQVGEGLRVRVEAVDPIARSVTLSLPPPGSAG